MNYNSLLDTKNKLIHNKLIKLELKLKHLQNTKTTIQTKIQNQSLKYDKMNISIGEQIKTNQDTIHNLNERILKYNHENTNIEKKN